MTLNEFKHWLDGYSESINEAPTKEQWAKIKEKLESLNKPEKSLNEVLGDLAKRNRQDIYPVPYGFGGAYCGMRKDDQSRTIAWSDNRRYAQSNLRAFSLK